MQHQASSMDKFWTLSVGFMALYEQFAKRQGITGSELAIWHALSFYGQCTQKQICEDWQLPKQTVFTICKRLAKAGLIEMAEQGSDKRQKWLTFTKQGRKQAEHLMAPLLAAETQTAVQFGEARFAKLLSEMQALKAVYEAKMGTAENHQE